VRYDRRGIGQSGGREESATVADYAEDALAVVNYLKRQTNVDRKKIVIVGYAEGGAMALLAAAKSNDVAALVLVNAPGHDGAEVVLEQQMHALSRLKLSDAERQAKIELQKRIQKAVLGTGVWQGIPDAMRRQADTPWFQSFLVFSPGKVMSKTDQPILVLQAGLDKQIEPTNADRLEVLARARKGKAGAAVNVVRMPNLNHLLVTARTGELDEYAGLADKQISADAVSAITSWLQTTLQRVR